ncbi:MAG: hypothetical protein CMB80_27530 [Flammeovirgaceae bacterium]|nr:hypothetical protein [Flammeovirgaceae bacterium]MBR11364.1 hypothetical protein [Rickettsiales bacterium]HCX21598.1 hypothetical protein [Cytophagales bacterium]|tara:strand:+ start:789 stop:1415 length:627 start_codon:yes stop_codon:yes gene_type:complete
MLDQDLKNIWQRSSSEEHIAINYENLTKEMTMEIESTNQKIKSRDQREIGASIIGILFYGYIGWDIPFFWSKVACGLLIVWFGYVIYRLKSQRKNEIPEPSLSIREQLTQRKEYLTGQANMLNNVLWWYILPPTLCNVLLYFGAGDPSLWDSRFAGILPESIVAKITVMIIIIAFNAYVFWINKKAVRTELKPLIHQVEQSLDQLSKS